MNKKIIFSFTLLVLFLPSLFSLTVIANNDYKIVMYQKYSSDLQVGTIHTVYEYSYLAYNTSNASNTETITYNSYKFYVNVGSLENFSGTIKVTVSPFTITVDSQIPQLARVLLIEPNLIRELVWAGFLNTSGRVSGLAYFNNTAQLVLEFLNGTTFTNITLNITHEQPQYSITTKMLMHKVSLTMIGEATLTLSFQTTYPRRYNEMEFTYQMINVQSPYNTSIAYYNGTYVPAMIWRGEGKGSIMFFSFNAQVTAEFTDIEFFGVNGSVIGYLDSSYISTYFSHKGFIFNNTINNVESHIKIVINPNAKYVKSRPELVSMINVNNNPVIIEVTNQGVESTANVNLYHQVIVIHPATLVYINVTGYNQYVLLFPNGSYQYVNLVTPNSVTISNVSIDGKSYVSQIVSVNASGYIVFNVSLIKNESVTVFKETSNGMVPLNPNNYFIYNGRLIVFSDPAAMYYVVYGYTPSNEINSISSLYLILIIIAIIVLIAIALLVTKRKK